MGRVALAVAMFVGASGGEVVSSVVVAFVWGMELETAMRDGFVPTSSQSILT